MAKITMSHMVTEKCAGYNFVLAPLTLLMIHFCGATVFPDQQQSKSSSFLLRFSVSHTLVAERPTTYSTTIEEF